MHTSFARWATAATAVLVAATLASSAQAKPIDKGQFHDVSSQPFTCESTGTPAREDVDVTGNFLLNQRGSSPFPYYRESVKGTVVWTNLDTGGTYTNVFTANSRDHSITDNGDGTITIESYASGGSRYYDQFGKLVLKDPGNIRFAIEIDFNGTPGNVDDDQEVPGSFRVIRPSTGRNDTDGRDFCTDLVLFTTP